MEKIIKFMILDNQVIKITNEIDECSITINDDKRVNAKEIYDLLAYNTGDTYRFVIEPDESNNQPVIYFKKLLEEIVQKIQTIN